MSFLNMGSFAKSFLMQIKTHPGCHVRPGYFSDYLFCCRAWPHEEPRGERIRLSLTLRTQFTSVQGSDLEPRRARRQSWGGSRYQEGRRRAPALAQTPAP
jgi:hypothetical protein